MKIIHIITSVGLLFCLVSCNWLTKTLCGEPGGKLKEFFDSVNIRYSHKLKLDQVPCYPGYAEISLKGTENLSLKGDSALIDSIEAELTRFGVVEVLVYDKDRNLLKGNTGSM